MTFWNDLRFAARTLRKSPGFAATAILTMALGSGATTAIFSVCDAMLWKPIPVPDLASLVMVFQQKPGDPHDYRNTTPGDTADIRREVTSLASMASWDDVYANLVGAGGEPERVLRYLVTSNFFDVLGVRPVLGRGFLPGEDQPGREREVVLSDALGVAVLEATLNWWAATYGSTTRTFWWSASLRPNSNSPSHRKSGPRWP